MFLTYIFAEVDAAGCEIYIPTPLQLTNDFATLPGCDGDYNKQAELMTTQASYSSFTCCFVSQLCRGLDGGRG